MAIHGRFFAFARVTETLRHIYGKFMTSVSPNAYPPSEKDNVRIQSLISDNLTVIAIKRGDGFMRNTLCTTGYRPVTYVSHSPQRRVRCSLGAGDRWSVRSRLCA